MKSFDLVVFDMAGTTVADNGAVPRAFMSALAEFDVSISPEELSGVRGASKREALAMLLGPLRKQEFDAIYARFVATLSETYRESGAKEIVGASDAFNFLKDTGLKIALNTGFERSIVELLLGSLGWRQSQFDAIICGDDVEHGRPAPDMIFQAMKQTGVKDAGRVINVGDTVLDMEAGRRAGAGANVAVLSGAHVREQLLVSPHTHMIVSVADLPKLYASG
ncbi:phosphonatase-like hydrolase [Hyphococcus sp.]|uniref:phosphonatase-like hydrolase n=1 Tax=Hyphococcus sp. TaxID=2038636 RepID=UPI00208D838F|nr:MAG: phosphonoacetaldehyde hydrolase [Marinicaulis sp.]